MGIVQCKEACNTFSCKLKEGGEVFGVRKETALPWYCNVDTDEDGCREFPPLPPPGEHPRLFFTKEEIPAIVAKITSSGCSDTLRVGIDHSVKMFREWYKRIEALSDDERDEPTREVIEAFMKPEPFRGDSILSAVVKGFVFDEETLVYEAIEGVSFYARVIVASHRIATEEGVSSKPFDIWHSKSFTLDNAFKAGGTAFAVCYDLLYNSFTPDQLEVMRKALALATVGRRSWGMGMAPRRIQSNWAGYHGDLLVMCAAIEGEEGYDEEVYNLFAELMSNYFEHAIYESGHPVEDAYAVNCALREGSMALLALARRGHNLFKHPRYMKLWREWMPFALEPRAGGMLYGGSSGDGVGYPTCFLVAKYMFPKDPIMDYVYRRYLNGYRRLIQIQSRGHALLFGIPARNETLEGNAVHLANDVDLPLTFSCNNRGKVIVRSDWTPDATWFVLDARGDAFLVGHDCPSRGAFILSAVGRNWATSPDWKRHQGSADFSLVTIDNVAQVAKAPCVRLLDHIEGPHSSTFMAADLTYAYNWTWTAWAKRGQDMQPAGWEHEPMNPRDFGMDVEWLPDKVFDEPDVGFTGLYQWRKRLREVEQVTRSALIVRDDTMPFVILCDVAKQDNEERVYAWNMAVPEDVVLLSFDNNQAVLGEQGDGGRRLVIQIMQAPDGSEAEYTCTIGNCTKEDRGRRAPDGSFATFEDRNFSIVRRSTDGYFNLCIFGVRSPDSELITSTFDASESLAVIQVPGEDGDACTEYSIKYGYGDSGEATMTVMEQ